MKTHFATTYLKLFLKFRIETNQSWLRLLTCWQHSCWVFNFSKNYCLYSSIFIGFFTCRSSLSSVLKWCSAWLTVFWVACLSSRTVLNRIWCSKSTVLFHWTLILPLLKGLAITGREGEDSQWPKTKEMYEVVSVVFYSNYNLQSGGSIPSVEVRYG